MIKKNGNTYKSRYGSKRETKKKNSNWYKIFFFVVYGFLTTQVVILLELEQVLKDFLDSKNYRTLIKLLDSTKRKYKNEKERMRK